MIVGAKANSFVTKQNINPQMHVYIIYNIINKKKRKGLKLKLKIKKVLWDYVATSTENDADSCLEFQPTSF